MKMEATATTPETSLKIGEDQLRRLRRAEVLLNVYQRTAALESLDDVLAAIVEIATRETKAEAGTLFLHDEQTSELYSRIMRGGYTREIRIQSARGVAGHVFSSGHGIFIPDAYQDERFDATIDEQTGFVTKSILCAPVKTVKGEVIGVIQTLNGAFSVDDLELLEAVATQASVALQSTRVIERMKKTRAQELKFLEIVSEITSEIELSTLLTKVMDEATKMLNAERGTLFLNDEKTGELFSLVGAGLQKTSIRFPNKVGIAGAVFTSAHSVHIPYAYADLRFNPSFDRTTGFFTRSILCVPIVTKKGKIIGVTQVLNKKGGTFTAEDESRLRAFTAQVSIALENAKLFDETQKEKNYNESMLESITNGVITLDEDGKIEKCNAAASRILGVAPRDIIGQKSKDFFKEPNNVVLDQVEKVQASEEAANLLDADLSFGSRKLSVNVTVQPLISTENDKSKKLGTLITFEDISDKKRLQSTLSRKLDARVVEQLLQQGEDVLGGASGVATVLFSDIRGFTTLTEELGAQGTVALLNEYFTVMVECIQREEGYLDKFIGDAIMAAFGVPLPHADDEDRSVRAAISMLTDLSRWNHDRIARGVKPVNIGIGLNTDTVVSGNIGTPKRNDYTLIGDGVNLAARLESACKQYGTKILISENTFRKLKGTYRTREVDRVVVKGKTEPVGVYEVLDYHDEKSFPNMSEVLSLFKDGTGHYRNRNWDRGITSFKEALRLHPDDGVSKHYISRCEVLKAEPPPEDWDGTWHMHEK